MEEPKTISGVFTCQDICDRCHICNVSDTTVLFFLKTPRLGNSLLVGFRHNPCVGIRFGSSRNFLPQGTFDRGGGSCVTSPKNVCSRERTLGTRLRGRLVSLADVM